MGHRPRKVVLAESKARDQLGPDYASYQLFLTRLDPVFRRGASVTWRASFIAYEPGLRDVLDTEVAWTEPWEDGR